MRVRTTIKNDTDAELRLCEFDATEAHNGKPFTEWQVWSGGVCIATLNDLQLKMAAEVQK